MLIKKKKLSKEDFKIINGNFIPSNKDKIDFDYKQKEYVFLESNNNYHIETVVNFFNDKNKNDNKNNYEESSEISSGYSLNQGEFNSEEIEEIEEEESIESDDESSNYESKNIDKTEQNEKVNSVKFNIERNEPNKLKTIKERRYTLKKKTIDYNLGINDCAYKVDLSKITLYRYNFKTNTFDDLKKMYNSSKFEEKMGLETSISDRLKRQKTVKKKTPLNKMMKLK